MKLSIPPTALLIVCFKTLAFAQDHIVPYFYTENALFPIPLIHGRFENDESSDQEFISFMLSTTSSAKPNRPDDSQFEISCYARVLDSNGTVCPIRLNCTGSVSFALNSATPDFPAGLGSDLINSIGSYMWVPRGPDGGFLALSPESPERYCLDNNMTGYTNFTHHNRFSVSAMISVISDNANPFPSEIAFPISYSNYWIRSEEEGISISRTLMDQIRADIMRFNGMQLVNYGGQFGVPAPCTDDIFDSFPPLMLTLASSDGVPIAGVVLEPRDYMKTHPRRRACTLQFYTDRSQRFLGQVFMNNVGILFDAIHQRIGFCQPL